MLSSIIDRYLSRIEAMRAQQLATAELSLRDALSQLLKEAAQELKYDVQFIGEGRATEFGRPDYIVTHRDRPLGYIEAEKLSADLDDLKGHSKEQNERFKKFDNFLLTNHYDFRLYRGGKEIARAHLGQEAGEDKFRLLLDRFLSSEAESPKTPGELARLLSWRAQQLRASILIDLQYDSSPSRQSFEAFKKILRPDMDETEFADLFAQTLAYGFFAARCVAPEGKSFNRYTAQQYLKSNPLLGTLFNHFTRESDSALDWIIDDIAHLLAYAPIEGIRDYFAERAGRADPMIDFYEPFLHAYDSKQRELRGVYYTPEPVVGYIVRSLHALLQSVFKLEGLTDKKALILDPATGTGSFLFAVFEAVRQEVQAHAPHDWPRYAREQLMPRLFGFELMVAPYTIAHLKLDLALDASGVELSRRDRVNVFLTNTLDDARRYSETIIEHAIAAEVNAAADVKEKEPILVVLGNPPYSGHSANASKIRMELAAGAQQREVRVDSGRQVTASKRRKVATATKETYRFTSVGAVVESYKFVDGAPLGEKNPKWLQDDYVKFLAFAQERIRRSGEGVIGFITNHGYLDNPTFRGMRKSFLDSFTRIYVLDLHGNAKKKETAPNGRADKNVFDIQQGVAIILAVKEKDKSGPAQVFHADLWGERADKYQALDAQDVTSTQWLQLTPSAPFYLFVPRDETNLVEYDKGWKVTEIFPVNVLGFQTHRDNFAIAFDENEIISRIEALRDKRITDEEIELRYKVVDNRDWQVTTARRRVQGDENWQTAVTTCAYRPFDMRACYFSEVAMDYPRRELINNVFHRQNLCLLSSRQQATLGYYHCFVAAHPANDCLISTTSREANQVFPLYLYESSLFGDEKRPNISEGYSKSLAGALGVKYNSESGLPQDVTPEAIFHHIYAVLHSPEYRSRYAAFLKTDFPRVPLPASPQQFAALAKIGAELVALHTLDTSAAPVLNETRHKLEGQGEGRIEKVIYEPSTRRVRFNETQSIENVDESTWQMRIGGYQPAEKWLKDRKGRILGFADLKHYNRLLIALAETRQLMQSPDLNL